MSEVIFLKKIATEEQKRITLQEFISDLPCSRLTRESFIRYTSMTLMTKKEWEQEFDRFIKGKL